MSLTSLSINRPVAVLMVVSLVVLLGVVSLTNTSTDLLPDITMPVVAVLTTYSGAGAREVESLVTRPIEEALGYVGGVDTISSQSAEGISTVIAEFTWGTNLDGAVLEIRDAIDLVKGYLPDDVSVPRVIKADLSLMPVLQVSLSGPASPLDLTRMAEKVRTRLERVEGVASTSIAGGTYQEARIELEPARLLSFGLTVPQVSAALLSENLSLPGGEIDEAGKRLVLRTQGEFASLAEVAGVALTSAAGVPVTVADLGAVKLAETEVTSITRVDGHPAVTISVSKQSGTNTVAISRAVREVLASVDDILAPGTSLEIVQDQADFINRAIGQVGETIWQGGLLAVLVLYLFLTEARTVAVIALSMPVSILATFAFMYFAGLTLNLVTMGGLALGIGMLVDNSIVILETIYRHRDLGLDQRAAAERGTHEVAMAVTASTLTTVVVFLPVVYVQGLASQVFKPLAAVVTLALGSSLLVSMTFLPMAAASLLRARRAPGGRLADLSGKFQAKLNGLYLYWVRRALARRSLVAVGVGVLVLLAVLAVVVLPQRLMPLLDRREVSIDVKVGKGSSLASTDAVMSEVEQLVMRRDDVQFLFLTAGGSNRAFGASATSDGGSFLVRLVPKTWRLPDTDEVAAALRRDLAAVPGAIISVASESSIVGADQAFGAPLAVTLRGDDLDTLAALADRAAELLGEVPGLVNVETTLVQAAPEVQIVVDRTRAAQAGIGSAYLATMVRAAVEGQVPTSLRLADEDIDVRVIFAPGARANLAQIANLLLLSPTGKLVRVGEVATLARAAGPTSINRLDGARVAEVHAELAGINLGTAEARAQQALAALSLPAGYTAEYTGETAEISDTFGSLTAALILGVVLVYMVMAAQFESLLDPLLIMITLPLALAGSVASMLVTVRSLNIASIVGLIAMVGVAVNNGIVLVDYANQLRREGRSAMEAAVEAGSVRLRPILMTSLTTIFGLLPMVLVRGEGKEMLASLSAPLLGGLFTSTVLTLFVLPVLYVTVAETRAAVRARRARAVVEEVSTDA